MGLTCGCDFDPEPGMTFAYTPDKHETLDTTRRQRCMSCNNLIDIGATAARIKRYKVAETEIEYKIYGEEVPLADKWFCEECADLCFSLVELGYCVNPHDNMHELVADYAEIQADAKKQEA